MYEFKKGNMFDNIEKDVILLHACNAQGVWGSGIAVEFKKRFPKSFEEYSLCCKMAKAHLPRGATGKCIVTKDNVGCLMSSFDYGSNKDDPEVILKNTELALKDLSKYYEPSIIYSPKINSGLFNVPWERTEAVIKKWLENEGKGFIWVVWEL